MIGARAVAASTALAALALAGCGSGVKDTPAVSPPAASPPASSKPFRGAPVLGSAEAADFALRDQHGRVIRLSQERGRLVLMTFLYTKCPDVCPLIAANVNEVLRGLTAPQRGRTAVIAVSTDPVHDTPRAVRAFVAEHRLLPQFHYLIGTRDELRSIWQAYNVLTEPGASGRVAHSAFVLLIDPAGKPRFAYSPQTPARDMLHDVRRMLLARTLAAR